MLSTVYPSKQSHEKLPNVSMQTEVAGSHLPESLHSSWSMQRFPRTSNPLGHKHSKEPRVSRHELPTDGHKSDGFDMHSFTFTQAPLAFGAHPGVQLQVNEPIVFTHPVCASVHSSDGTGSGLKTVDGHSLTSAHPRTVVLTTEVHSVAPLGHVSSEPTKLDATQSPAAWQALPSQCAS